MSGAVNLHYVHSESIGYGRMGVKLAAALEAKGVEVYDHMPVPEGVKYSVAEAEGRNEGTAGSTCWLSVPTHATGWWDTQHVSILTMWEAMRLPEQFRESLHHYDTVMVPSDQNVELFSQYHDNVKRVMLGVDPDEWHFIERTDPEVDFNFLIGGSGERKGTDLAFRAFQMAFPPGSWGDGPTPRLIFKSPRGGDWTYDGRVSVVPGKLEPADEQALYATAHVYLQPSRGEGFGLQPLQAMAQGLPTILTDAHGHGGFAHLGYGLSSTPITSGYFIYGDAGEWWEPDLDELVELMRYTYEDYGIAKVKGEVAAKVIAHDFTWANTAEQFLDAVPVDRPFVPGGWVSPSPLKYRIRTVRPFRCDIAGRRVVFEAGVDYWELADIKRIFAEAGQSGDKILDDDCLNGDDRGLTDAQIDELGLPTGTTGPVPRYAEWERAHSVAREAHVAKLEAEGRDVMDWAENGELLYDYGFDFPDFDDWLQAQQGDPDLTLWHAGV